MREKFDGITVIAGLFCGPAFLFIVAAAMFFGNSAEKMNGLALAFLYVTVQSNRIVDRWKAEKSGSAHLPHIEKSGDHA